MADNTILSFIIPVYNTPKTLLHKCISSICIHRELEYEIIIIDDGSNLDVAEVCDEVEQTYKQVKVFHQTNQGVSCARNNGIINSIGKYIVFVDPDDYVLDGLFDEQLFIENEQDIIFFNYIREDSEGKKVEYRVLAEDMVGRKEQLVRNILFLPNDFHPYVMGAIWGKAFRSEFIKRNALTFNKNLWKSEDRLFMLYAITASKKIRHVDVPSYVYFENTISTSRSYKPNCYNNSKRLLDEIVVFFSQTNFSLAIQKQALSKVVFVVFFEILYHDIFNKNKQISIKERLDEANIIYKKLNVSEMLRPVSGTICMDKVELIKYELVKWHQLLLLYILLNKFRK